MNKVMCHEREELFEMTSHFIFDVASLAGMSCNNCSSVMEAIPYEVLEQLFISGKESCESEDFEYLLNVVTVSGLKCGEFDFHILEREGNVIEDNLKYDSFAKMILKEDLVEIDDVIEAVKSFLQSDRFKEYECGLITLDTLLGECI